MWNYNFVVPSFMILLILLSYFFSRPQIPVRINRAFVVIAVLECLVIMSDLLASEADEMYASFPAWVLYVLNMIYFVLFLARIYSFFMFTVSALGLKFESARTFQMLSVSVFFISELITLSSFFTGAVFSIGPQGYQKGPLYNVIYVCFLYYLGFSYVLTLKYRDRLKPVEWHSLIGETTVLLIGVIARFLFPKVLIMNLFCLMAIIILYLSFMNPDFFGSDRGPAFNIRAFTALINEEKDRRPFRILGFVIHNYTDAREIYGTTQMDQGISLITEYLAYTFPKYYRFYLRNGCFALFGDETMDWDAIQKTIQERFQSHWKADEADLFLNISFVKVSSVSPHDDTDTIINRLYSAFNEAGRKNGSELVIDLDQIHDVDRQVDVKRTLEHCIEKDAVEIFLQPLIDSSNNEMVGAEVLARIRHEDGHIIPPGIFIPIAEQNGQINRLGAQVFEKACRFIHDGFLAETGMKWLNVNLSPVQCMKKDLAAEFGAILRKYDVGADQIRLEITEASMIDFSLLQRQITELRSNGFQFALDDYGSGYSNLTRVKHYPFINIKLDMEVVWDYIRDRDLLLPAIVSAFKQLKFSVTAEGIESADMADAMKDIGCDYLQGYYFSQPMPVEDFLGKYRITPSA